MLDYEFWGPELAREETVVVSEFTLKWQSKLYKYE